MPKPEIFISYRRADSQAFSGRIYDRLAEAFGAEHIFKDVDRIPPGTSFAQVLEQALDRADILLVIIGEQWLNITGKTGARRLDDPEDWVRQEVERGLERDDVTVIPVFIGNAAIPDPAELPESLRKLLSYQVVRVREDPDFHRDMDRLIKWLAPKQRPWRLWAGAALVVLLALIAGIGLLRARTDDVTVTPPAATESAALITPTPLEQAVIPTETPQIATSVPATLAATGILVSSTSGGIRLRDAPENGAIVGEIVAGETLTVLSGAENIGKSGSVQVRNESGIEGWMSGLSLVIVTGNGSGVPMGVTFNLSYDLTRIPPPQNLGKITWVRLVYNVSYNPDDKTSGNTDLERARQHYAPMLKSYADAGYKIMLVLTHQTYGEGQGAKYGNWENMSDDTWRSFTTQFAIVARQIAEQYKGVVSAYQIWNEPDAPPDAVSTIPMNATSYADLLVETMRGIRRADPDALVITGGMSSDRASAIRFINDLRAALPSDVRPDGIAIHLYGVAGTDGPYAPYGTIAQVLPVYADAAGDYPLWITEWGAVNRTLDTPAAIADYARDFMDALNSSSVPIQAAIWYSLAGGDSSYGLVDAQGNPRSPLYEVLTGK